MKHFLLFLLLCLPLLLFSQQPKHTLSPAESKAQLERLYDACDEEVIRAISGMPKWKPGTNMGQPVNCYYHVPVTFRNDEPTEER